jgi:hypothetical protein
MLFGESGEVRNDVVLETLSVDFGLVDGCWDFDGVASAFVSNTKV